MANVTWILITVSWQFPLTDTNVVQTLWWRSTISLLSLFLGWEKQSGYSELFSPALPKVDYLLASHIRTKSSSTKMLVSSITRMVAPNTGCHVLAPTATVLGFPISLISRIPRCWTPVQPSRDRLIGPGGALSMIRMRMMVMLMY